MEAQRPSDNHRPSSAAVNGNQAPLKQYGTIQSPAPDVDMASVDNDRAQRAASVLSGMSAEDMEAAETLNSLHASKTSLHVSIGPSLTSNPRISYLTSKPGAANSFAVNFDLRRRYST